MTLVEQYLRNKEAHLNSTLHYFADGIKIIEYKGNFYPEEAFNKLFKPHWRVESLAKNQSDNSDKTKQWLNS